MEFPEENAAQPRSAATQSAPSEETVPQIFIKYEGLDGTVLCKDTLTREQKLHLLRLVMGKLEGEGKETVRKVWSDTKNALRVYFRPDV